MKRSTGSVRSLSQAPERVITPFTALPQEGTQSMMVKVMPMTWAHSGRAVKCRWCGPAQIYMNIKAQKLMIERRYDQTGRFACLGRK
jgi:hypothetical protein